MGRRRHSRELALQFRYQYDAAQKSPDRNADIEGLLNFFWEQNCGKSDDEIKDFFYLIIKGSCSNLLRINEIIERYSEHWKLSRISSIDRNILRIAVYELVYLSNIPPAVTINEAVELGKTFGTEDSGAFINGILDKIRIALDKGELSI